MLFRKCSPFRDSMTAFLFWNLNRKDLRPFVVDLVERHKVDVLMLVESAVAPAQFLQTANSGDQTNWEYAPGIGCKRVEVFTRFPVEFARPIHETERLTIRHLCPPGRTDILLAVMHFPGKPHWKEGSQAIECVPLSDAIKSAEDKIGHRRTVLVGDFNMSPFGRWGRERGRPPWRHVSQGGRARIAYSTVTGVSVLL